MDRNLQFPHTSANLWQSHKDKTPDSIPISHRGDASGSWLQTGSTGRYIPEADSCCVAKGRGATPAEALPYRLLWPSCGILQIFSSVAASKLFHPSLCHPVAPASLKSNKSKPPWTLMLTGTLPDGGCAEPRPSSCTINPCYCRFATQQRRLSQFAAVRFG